MAARSRCRPQAKSRMEWNLSTDVVVIGAAALAAAVSARDHGAAVIVVEENFDIGGHAMLSGGRVHLGGGNALQKKYKIEDSPDRVFEDWTTHERGDSRYNDRDLVRTFADECVPTFQFLLDNGVTFIEKPIVTPDASTVPRVFVTHEWHCLLYTSDAADDLLCVDLGGRRIIKKK